MRLFVCLFFAFVTLCSKLFFLRINEMMYFYVCSLLKRKSPRNIHTYIFIYFLRVLDLEIKEEKKVQ